MSQISVSKIFTFKRLLKLFGFEFEKVNKEHRKSIGWKAKRHGDLYVVKVLDGTDNKSFEEGQREVLSAKAKLQCNFAMLLSDKVIPRDVLSCVDSDSGLLVCDRSKIGAYFALLASTSVELQPTEVTAPRQGHYSLEGHLNRSANVFITADMESTFHIQGFACYGNLKRFGPNMGSFSVPALDLAYNASFFDLATPRDSNIFTAALLGNQILLEYASEYWDDVYQACFTFSEFGMTIEETNPHMAPFGHNVTFAGYYEQALFPSMQIKRFEVSDIELENLSHDFRGTYRSFQIGSTEIRNWLDQFTPPERRPMFYLLAKMRFYNNAVTREAAIYLHRHFLEMHELDPEQCKDTIVLAAFGTPAKSGSSLVRIYKQENKLDKVKAIGLADLSTALQADSLLRFLIIVEDVVGTGQDIVNLLKGLNEKVGEQLAANKVTAVIQSICCLEDGKNEVLRFAKTLPFSVSFYTFETHSKFFVDPPEPYYVEESWDEIRVIAEKYGKRLNPSAPLGYGDSQMLVVFHDNCPNNTLPVFWASSTTTEFYWRPLFPRV